MTAAARYNSVAVLKILLEHVETPIVRTFFLDVVAVVVCFVSYLYVSFQDYTDLTTALNYAAGSHNIVAMKLLLEHCAGPIYLQTDTPPFVRLLVNFFIFENFVYFFELHSWPLFFFRRISPL